MITCREVVKSLRPYVPGKPIEEVQKEYNLTNVIKLASNENPLGCSQKAKEAIISSLENVEFYPDGNATKLRKALSKNLDVNENQLIFGAGSDEIITMLAKTFIEKDDEAITCTPTFPQYKSAVTVFGGKIVEVPLVDYTYDLEGIVNAITDKTKIIFISNPNNPTGTIITAEQQLEFIKKVPSNVLIVMDEAYSEYIIEDEYPKTLPLLEKYPNIIILRTFSKAYGLASLRVGYGIANESIIELLNRVRGPFNVTSAAISAATASLEDKGFLTTSIQTNNEVKSFIYKKCKEMDFDFIPTYGNFIMIETEKIGNDLEVFNKLQSKGIIVRPGSFLGLKGWQRVTIGTMEQMEFFFNILKELI